MSRRLFGSLAMAALLCSVGLVSNDARACGGCFSGGGEPTIVTSHRMALSISTDRTVLWDQIRYQGDPEEFAWVLPVRPGATIELASDAFFEALDAATTVNAFRPQNAFCDQGYDDWDGDHGNDYYDRPTYFGACSMAGCAAEGAGRDSYGAGGGGGSWGGGGGRPGEAPPVVEVVHEDSIGPYEAVVLSSNEPGALYDWLLSHGYAIDPDMEPVIDGYEADGFDFVALRLIPGATARQMTPVRITSPGAAPVLPLKMVAAGTGASVGMTLFLLGEGRWEAQGFLNSRVDTAALAWDFATSSSNYAALRAEALGQNHGANWLTTYSKQGALLSPVFNPVSMQYTQYSSTNGYPASSIAELYAAQGFANGEIADMACVSAFQQAGASGMQVVDPCAPAAPEQPAGEGGAGGAGGAMSGGGADPAGAGGAGAAGGVMSGGGAPGAGGRFPDGGGNAGGRFPAGAGGAGAGGAGMGGAGGEAGAPECAGTVEPDQIDARGLACGPLDDVAVALVGMHPADVWVTRLEAELPKRALQHDLGLQASLDQSPVENWLYSATSTGDPCAAGATSAPPPRPRLPHRGSPLGARDLIALAAALALLSGVAARRHLRPLRAARARS